jgi:hypothetical protein
VARAAASVRSIVETGPTVAVGTGRAVHRLAPWLALAGAVLLAVLVVLRVTRGRFVRYQMFEYRNSLGVLRGGHR